MNLPPRTRRRIEQLIATLGDSDNDIAAHAETLLMRHYAARALERLIEATAHPNAQMRWRAAWVLASTHDPRAYDSILRLLSDEDATTRYEAAIALGNLGNARGVEPLIALMSIPDPEHCVDDAAGMGLTRLGKPAIPALLVLLNAEQAHLRRSAVRVLAIIKDERAIEPIARLRTDPEEAVRVEVIEALEDFGTPRCLALLTTCLDDPSSRVREIAESSYRAVAQRCGFPGVS